MSVINEQFQSIIDNIDKNPDAPVDQQRIIDEFKKHIPENYQLTFEERAEVLAFSLVDLFTSTQTDSGNYFGPQATWMGADGLVYETPSLKEINPEMIAYWDKRAAVVRHPFLTARYAGLVWNLSLPIAGNQPTHRLRKQFIDASLDLVKKRQFKYSRVAVGWLSRALEIASNFNDQEFFDQVKDTILVFEKELNEQEKPGQWGFGYDLLLANKKIKIKVEDEMAIIDLLEQKLAAYSNPGKDGKTDPWATEAAATRLADYYHRKNRPEDVKRVILSVGNAYEPLFTNSSALQISGWLQKIYQLYNQYRLNENGEVILKRLREVSAKAAKEMGGFEHKLEVPKDEVDFMIASIYAEGGNSPFENIIGWFSPNKEQARKQLFDLAKIVPTLFLFPKQIQDYRGRTIANVGPLERDEDGHVILRISEQLTFYALFLHLTLEAGHKKGILTTDSILKFLSHSAILDKNRFPILKKALEYYFGGDYLGFAHLAIPQIEEAIRNMIELNGGKVLKYKDGVFQLRTFDDVLRDSIVTTICGENTRLYFKILFTDPRGWNLRNDICHGMAEYELFTKQTADRILHALLTLGVIRYSDPE